ncbi:MAG: NACHT domain-containing protein, partial [Desulfobacteraceae bacterium]
MNTDFYKDLSGLLPSQMHEVIALAKIENRFLSQGAPIATLASEVNLWGKQSPSNSEALKNALDVVLHRIDIKETTPSSQDNGQVEISGIQSVETLLRSNILSTGGPLALKVENLLSTGSRGLSDPSLHRKEELEFLSRMEAFIKEELRKSGDEHFVELSMQFSDPMAPQDDRLKRSFSLVYGEMEKEQPPIPDIVGLEAALSKYRNLVLLGSPGSGKTTVLQHMTLQQIGAYRRKESHLLPIYAPLTKYTRKEPTLSFLKRHVLDLVGERQFVASNFLDLAKLGRCILILDGLDQMPDRRSETIRLDRLRALENDLRRMDGAIKWMRRFRQKKWELELVQGRHQVTSQIAPTIDRREREIEKLPELCASSVVTSCRIRDFVGAPSWQSLVVLPMDELQIREFIEKYAPEALDEVQQQWQVTAGTRSLIRNPFYLSMLTQALRRTHQDDKQKKEFIRAVLKRGRLLEFLLRLGIERELESLKHNPDLGVEDVIDSLGRLSYYMLEHNIIGAVPYNVIERWLGKELELILKVAQGANILWVRPGPPIRVDFNHQLFLEFLLAF